MENVEEQILSYPHLPVEKQREIESYVESHPEWAPLLRDVRSIESFIRDAGTESSSDTLVTTYVVVEHLHPGAVPSGLKETFRRLEKEMEGNSTLRKRVQSARRRLEEAEAALDPVTHFEEVSGHAFETDAKESSTTADPAASTGKETRGTGSSFGAFVDELLRVPTPLRWAGAAAALLLGAYGTLFVISQSSQSTLDRLAQPVNSTLRRSRRFSPPARLRLVCSRATTPDLSTGPSSFCKKSSIDRIGGLSLPSRLISISGKCVWRSARLTKLALTLKRSSNERDGWQRSPRTFLKRSTKSTRREARTPDSSVPRLGLASYF
ncbi:MAG: hypothetical protein BRD25_05265 [Bacteroidetes bacterium QH_1_61_8]|nr:MAG: hypothetical protein BRD25_05265 [Bacteroidetes bacterium QH_1_61_8]